MLRHVTTSAAILLCLAIAIAAPHPAEQLLTDSTDPGRLVFDGVRYFKESSIRKALSEDLQYHLLCQPEQPLQACLDYLFAKIVRRL
jgi:hypothetical protein